MDTQQRRGRGGRPRSPSPRTAQVSVRISRDERAQLEEAAGPRGLAEYLRAAGLRRSPRITRNVPPVNGEAWRQLAPVFSNLNQLTRAAHEGRFAAAEVLPVLADLAVEVRALRAALLGQAIEEDAA